MESLPRPEYPRPHFARKGWRCLNGEWEFDFDDAQMGRQQEWFKAGHRLSRRIVVPFPYQSELSGLNDKGVHEVVWYARDLEVPKEWRERDLLLHFGAVDYRTQLWVNGVEVGHNRGGHVPFQFDIAPYLEDGPNRIVMRVEDRQDPLQPRGKQSLSGKPAGIDYYCTTGIWQTVWLEPVSAIRFEDVKITPRLGDGGDDAFFIEIFLHAPAGDWTVEVAVFDEDGEQVAETRSEDGSPAQPMLIGVADSRRWSPASPHLYRLRFRLKDGEELLDEVEVLAGMRDVSVRDGKIFLNGEPCFLKMVLDQGYWPDGIYTAPSDEAYRKDIELVKAFGFNGVRKHQKIEDPRWLYWCDRMGLLVWAEMPNARKWSTDAEETFIAEWERAVRRDYNHPCIVTWVPLNESWGVPLLGKNHPGQYAFVERVVAVTRRIDHLRPVVDNDGWEHTDVGDIAAIHDYTPTGEQIYERWRSFLEEGELPERTWHEGETVHFAHGSQYRGQPVVLSEVGGFLMMPQEAEEQDLDWLYTVYGTVNDAEELLEKYRDLMEGLARLTFLAGFCYTQLTDIEVEINGLTSYDRKPKVEPGRIRDVLRGCFSER
jgi:beta-galactosidase/beta-glucuronidase